MLSTVSPRYSRPVPTSAQRALLLRFDGVVHTSDLPTQAFARHLTAGLPADRIPALIGGMRGFLEGKPELIPPGVDLGAAEDGEQAVELLAAAFGIDPEQVEAARSASRLDFTDSVWAVDAADGLDRVFAASPGRLVWADADDPAVPALLASAEIEVDGVIAGPFPAAMAAALEWVSGGDPAQLTVIGTRWAGELEIAHRAGSVTVLLDRYRAVLGTPTIRSRDLTQVPAHLTS